MEMETGVTVTVTVTGAVLEFESVVDSWQARPCFQSSSSALSRSSRSISSSISNSLTHNHHPLGCEPLHLQHAGCSYQTHGTPPTFTVAIKRVSGPHHGPLALVHPLT